MGRGRDSKAIIRTGEISCITCPCGWEVSLVMNDEARCRKMADLKMKLHVRKCNRVRTFNTTEDYDVSVPYAGNAERNIALHKKESFEKNLINIGQEQQKATTK
tara:strand:+ start:784 stop:1095 length:312 start_codon:yes stop_codon:yes gene_type:complete